MTTRLSSPGPFLAVSIALTLLAAATPARADNTTMYPGSGCWGNTGDVSVTRPGDGSIVAGNQGAKVTCPLPKTTSGPNVTTNDAIYGVELQIDTGSGDAASIACEVIVYKNHVADRNTNDIVQIFSREGHAEGQHLTAVGFDFDYDDWNQQVPADHQTMSNFWNQGDGGWLASELHCTLTAGGKINSYVVAERGTDTHARIYPATSCAATPDNTSWWLISVPSAGELADGGYLQSHEPLNGNTHETFSVSCPSAICPAGDTACQMNVGTGRAIDLASTTNTNGNVVCGGQVITQAAAGDSQLVPQTHSFTVPSDSFACTEPSLGDGRLYSYRVSANSGTQQLINGNIRISIPFNKKDAYVVAFVRLNGVQVASGNIVASGVLNPDGTWTYSRELPASQFHVGDVINTRFYSYAAGQPAVFTPGPLEFLSYPNFVYGGPAAPPPTSCRPTHEQLANGSVRVSYTFPTPKSYVEAFVKVGNTQVAAGNIVQSGVANFDGTYTYSRVLPASLFSAGSVVSFRFYSYVTGQPGVFTPGPAESVWFPSFTYGQSPTSDCPQ